MNQERFDKAVECLREEFKKVPELAKQIKCLIETYETEWWKYDILQPEFDKHNLPNRRPEPFYYIKGWKIIEFLYSKGFAPEQWVGLWFMDQVVQSISRLLRKHYYEPSATPSMEIRVRNIIF